MCRNIKILFNFDPPVTDDEVQAASLQFVRKISGFNKPSKANEHAFLGAVEEIAGVASRLLRSLETNAPPQESGRRSGQGESSGRRKIRDLSPSQALRSNDECLDCYFLFRPPTPFFLSFAFRRCV